jgi:hypothetical protein
MPFEEPDAVHRQVVAQRLHLTNLCSSHLQVLLHRLLHLVIRLAKADLPLE